MGIWVGGNESFRGVDKSKRTNYFPGSKIILTGLFFKFINLNNHQVYAQFSVMMNCWMKSFIKGTKLTFLIEKKMP